MPYKAIRFLEEHEQIIYMVFMAVILFTDVLNVPLSFLSGILFDGLDWFTSLFMRF